MVTDALTGPTLQPPAGGESRWDSWRSLMAYTAAVVTLEGVSILTLLVPPTADPSRPGGRVVLVGGVPGAGKTTAIARAGAEVRAGVAPGPAAVPAGARRRP